MLCLQLVSAALKWPKKEPVIISLNMDRKPQYHVQGYRERPIKEPPFEENTLTGDREICFGVIFFFF